MWISFKHLQTTNQIYGRSWQPNEPDILWQRCRRFEVHSAAAAVRSDAQQRPLAHRGGSAGRRGTTYRTDGSLQGAPPAPGPSFLGAAIAWELSSTQLALVQPSYGRHPPTHLAIYHFLRQKDTISSICRSFVANCHILEIEHCCTKGCIKRHQRRPRVSSRDKTAGTIHGHCFPFRQDTKASAGSLFLSKHYPFPGVPLFI